MANGALKRCEGTTEECDASAIKQANGVIAKQVEEVMSAEQLAQIAKSAIETGLAIVHDSGEITQERAVKFFHHLESELKIWSVPGEAVAETATFSIDGDNVTLDELKEAYSTQCAAAKEHLETKESVMDVIAEMKSVIRAHLKEANGSLRDTANRVEEAFHAAYSPKDRWEGAYHTRDVYIAHPVLGDAVVVLDRRDAMLRSVNFTMSEDGIEFAPPAEWQPVVLTYSLKPMQEMESDGVAVGLARDATEADLSEVDAAIEAGRRAPVVIDFQVLQPGPGNKKDGHYYPADVVERDIHVFSGVDVFATDHNESERSELTKVGKVLDCPTGFTESKAPVAQVLIYDPAQAEKARNRADSDALDTLECSIFGNGEAKEGEIDGKTYKIVESITRGRYLELVSKAGAGGKALNLAESEPGGHSMEDKDKADATPVEEVEIEEAEAEAGVEPEQVQKLEVGVITEALGKTNLPEFAKKSLATGQYANDTELQEAIKEAIAEVKKLSGSGAVSGLGESEPEAEQESLEEREKRDTENFNVIMRDVGLKEV